MGMHDNTGELKQQLKHEPTPRSPPLRPLPRPLRSLLVKLKEQHKTPTYILRKQRLAAQTSKRSETEPAVLRLAARQHAPARWGADIYHKKPHKQHALILASYNSRTPFCSEERDETRVTLLFPVSPGGANMSGHASPCVIRTISAFRRDGNAGI